jgi:hypothetical protein
MTFCGRPRERFPVGRSLTASIPVGRSKTASCIGKQYGFPALCLFAVVLLSATGCTNPMLSKPAAAKPPAEKPDFSKLRPGTQCRVELSVVEKNGSPAHVAYTGTVSRVQGDEVTLVETRRKTPATKEEPVGTISIPFADIGSVKIDEEPTAAQLYRRGEYNRMRSG